jgi:dihydropyrimidinase
MGAEMTFDTLITGGTLVDPAQGLFDADIAIQDGKIRAVVSPGSGLSADRVINAAGLHILPGVIEPHSHLGLGNGLEDYETETRSAALGGVTSILTFLRQPEDYLDVFAEIKNEAQKRAFIDFSFHAVLMSEQHLLSLERYYNEFGITSFKFYLTYRGHDAQFMGIEGIDDGFMYDCLDSIAKLPNGVMIIHSENIEIINRFKNRLQKQDRNDLKAWIESRPDFAEAEAARRAMYLAEITNCRIHFLHMTSQRALNEISSHLARYNRISIEACHPYLFFTQDDMKTLEMKVKPPFRTPKDIEALWEGIRQGLVTSIGSDHVPRPGETKLEGTWSLVTGVPGTGLLLPVMLSEGFHRRKIPLQQIAAVTSANTARLYNMYPQKGALNLGSDADIVLVDLQQEKTVKTAEVGSVAGYCPHEGKVLKGWPTTLISRGDVIVENGKVAVQKGRGRYLAR